MPGGTQQGAAVVRERTAEWIRSRVRLLTAMDEHFQLLLLKLRHLSVRSFLFFFHLKQSFLLLLNVAILWPEDSLQITNKFRFSTLLIP